MDLRVIAQVGRSSIVYTALGIAVCLTVGTLLARTFHVGQKTGLLISIGTAICGGSAIAAAAPTLRPREDEVAVALATVFLLNAVALFVFPLIGHAVALDQEHFGLWAALAIHDTSSVVGAAMAYGPQALEVATVVKLARALWIVPVTLGLGWMVSHRRGAPGDGRVHKAPKPWFIAAFLGAAAVVTTFPSLRPIGHQVSSVAKHLMSATMFLIGAGLTRSALRTMGVLPFLMGAALWLVVAGLSLCAVVLWS